MSGIIDLLYATTALITSFSFVTDAFLTFSFSPSTFPSARSMATFKLLIISFPSLDADHFISLPTLTVREILLSGDVILYSFAFEYAVEMINNRVNNNVLFIIQNLKFAV